MITKTNVGTSAIQIAGHNPRRNWFIIQNLSSIDQYVAFTENGHALTGLDGAYPGIKIPAGEYRGMGAGFDDFLNRESIRRPIFGVREKQTSVLYSSDFSSDADNVTSTGDSPTGNQDTIGPSGDQRNDCLLLAASLSSTPNFTFTIPLSGAAGKQVQVALNAYVDGVGGCNLVAGGQSVPTDLDAWKSFTLYTAATVDGVEVQVTDGNYGALYVRDIVVTERYPVAVHEG